MISLYYNLLGSLHQRVVETIGVAELSEVPVPGEPGADVVAGDEVDTQSSWWWSKTWETVETRQTNYCIGSDQEEIVNQEWKSKLNVLTSG